MTVDLPPSDEPSPAPRCNEIFGVGEMAALTRAFDWSQTPLGPIDRWPDPLLTAVNMLLANPHPMFLWWGSELIQFYNDAYRPSLGSDKHPHALGQHGKECWPEIWPIIGPQIDSVMQRGESTWHENALVPIYREGKLEDVYWTYSYSPVRDLAGDICGTLVTCTETTHKHLVEINLRAEIKRLGDLFQQAPAFFAILRGPRHVFELTNPLYQELIGQRHVLGKGVLEGLPETEAQGFIRLLDAVYRTGVPFVGRNTPIKLGRPGSNELEEHALDFIYQPLREADGAISGIMVLGVDVTDARRAEQALIQNEKLAAVGRLASSIAHEINNPLESVTNLLYLSRQAAVSPEVVQYLTTAEVELRRVAEIANQTLRFHRQSTGPKPTLAGELLDSTLPLYQGRFANCQISVDRRDRAPRTIRLLDGEVRQVLSNLIANAIDAMSHHGGRLLLRTRETTEAATGRRGVVFTVADTGSGMSSETQSRIFAPFFTTKGLSGTGLGLWICREIVDRHHGALHLRSSESRRHHGTVFTLFLPFEAQENSD